MAVANSPELARGEESWDPLSLADGGAVSDHRPDKQVRLRGEGDRLACLLFRAIDFGKRGVMRVVVTGATGNVATSLLGALSGDEVFKEIVALARRKPALHV